VLVPLLTLTLHKPDLGFWPSRGSWTWQSLLFWSLFRTLNISTMCLAALHLAALDGQSLQGLAGVVRLAGLVVFLVVGALYLYTLFALGRANTYCRRGGLVTDGIYCWTRNPQYATVIPAFAGLALTAHSPGVYLLTALLIGVYMLMAHAEEPWLLAQYGEAYRRYQSDVPRYFNFRRGWTVLLRAAERSRGPMAAGRGRRPTHQP
jgi:protein-S-isoprenylcysteine O-methyltransferase Ste14